MRRPVATGRGTCDELLPLIPAEKAFAVAEGGLGTAEDVERMDRAGAKAVTTTGTGLTKDGDPAGVLERVLGIAPAQQTDE